MVTVDNSWNRKRIRHHPSQLIYAGSWARHGRLLGLGNRRCPFKSTSSAVKNAGHPLTATEFTLRPNSWNRWKWQKAGHCEVFQISSATLDILRKMHTPIMRARKPRENDLATPNWQSPPEKRTAAVLVTGVLTFSLIAVVSFESSNQARSCASKVGWRYAMAAIYCVASGFGSGCSLFFPPE